MIQVAENATRVHFFKRDVWAPGTKQHDDIWRFGAPSASRQSGQLLANSKGSGYIGRHEPDTARLGDAPGPVPWAPPFLSVRFGSAVPPHAVHGLW